LFLSRLVLLHLDAVLLGPRIAADSGHLPRHFHVRTVGADGEAVVCDLRVDDGLCEAADDRQLVAEVAIERLEPVGKLDDRDAVAFRAARWAQFAEAAERERALENNEGLAEYTGWALRGTTAEESRLAFARHLDNIDPATSFVRGFAYETGPAYGLLLDALMPGWTRKYKVTDDLAAFTGLKAGSVNPDAYGGAELRAAEERRDREQRERVARLRARLVDGPVLELPMTDANYGFDPNGVTALGEAGNAYEHLEVTAAWGKISVDGGARITGDFTAIVVAAADRAKLELKPGWKVVAGARQGDLRIVHE